MGSKAKVKEKDALFASLEDEMPDWCADAIDILSDFAYDLDDVTTFDGLWECIADQLEAEINESVVDIMTYGQLGEIDAVEANEIVEEAVDWALDNVKEHVEAYCEGCSFKGEEPWDRIEF